VGLYTPIEWCDSTVNPVMGCDGCELWMPSTNVRHCYAGQLHQVRAGRPGYADRFEEPKPFAGRMAAAARWSDLTGKPRPDKPWLDGLPRLIFVSDMGDALSRDVPFDFLLDEVISNVTTSHGARHRWLWLTKQPARMAKFANWLEEAQGIGWPANLWAGTSITSAKQKGRITALRRVPAAVRFVSAEPLLSDPGPLDLDGIALLILGGESGPDARPCELKALRSAMGQARAAGCKVFIKQVGAVPIPEHPADMVGRQIWMWRSRTTLAQRLALNLRDRKGGDPAQWPADLRMRELPAVRP